MKVTLMAITIGLFSCFFGHIALAQQIVEVEDDGDAYALISKKEITRISVEDDRILKVANGDIPYSITHDPDKGDLYLRPQSVTIVRPVNMFVTTEKGFTYKVILEPQDIPSAHILLTNFAAVAQAAKAKELDPLVLQAPVHEAIVILIRAMATGGVIEGFDSVDVVAVPQIDELFPDMVVKPTARWKGGAFIGEELEGVLKLKGDVDELTLMTQSFASLPYIAGIWIEHSKV